MHTVPQLRALQDKYAKQLVILGVNAGESPAEGAAAARRLNLNYPVLLRGDPLMEEYGATGFPTTFLIDPAGRITEAQVGANPELWPRVEAAVARFHPPGGDDREGAGGPRKAAQITHELTFPMPPGPREWVVGQEVTIRFKRPEGLPADLVSLSVDGKQQAIFGVDHPYPWDASQLPGGVHTLRLSAQTASGRETWATEQTVIVDNRPIVEPASPARPAAPTKPTTGRSPRTRKARGG
jgi:hypothetical protein